MDLIALSRLGGRHLVTLHLLLDTQSVTRSAERLCTTPSTVSKTLNQLRDLLGDQLLYRQGNQGGGYQPLNSYAQRDVTSRKAQLTLQC